MAELDKILVKIINYKIIFTRLALIKVSLIINRVNQNLLIYFIIIGVRTSVKNRLDSINEIVNPKITVV